MSAPRPRIILDSNVVISRTLVPNSVSGRAFTKAMANGVLLASSGTIQELEEVLQRKKFDRITPLAKRMEAFLRYCLELELISITHTITDCRDPQDNKFLELALSGKATLILTGDEDLLTLHPWRGISILSPSDYLALA